MNIFFIILLSSWQLWEEGLFTFSTNFKDNKNTCIYFMVHLLLWRSKLCLKLYMYIYGIFFQCKMLKTFQFLEIIFFFCVQWTMRDRPGLYSTCTQDILSPLCPFSFCLHVFSFGFVSVWFFRISSSDFMVFFFSLLLLLMYLNKI